MVTLAAKVESVRKVHINLLEVVIIILNRSHFQGAVSIGGRHGTFRLFHHGEHLAAAVKAEK